jgi:hypothetical protein
MEVFSYRESLSNTEYVKIFFDKTNALSKDTKGAEEKFFSEKSSALKRLVGMHLNKKSFQLNDLSDECLNLIPKKMSAIDRKNLCSEVKKIINIAHAEALKSAKKQEKIDIKDFDDPEKPLLKRKNVFKDEVNQFINETLLKGDAGSLIKNLVLIGAKESGSEKGHRKFTLHGRFTVVPYHGKSGEIGFALRRSIIEQIIGENWNEIYSSEENSAELRR